MSYYYQIKASTGVKMKATTKLCLKVKLYAHKHTHGFALAHLM